MIFWACLAVPIFLCEPIDERNNNILRLGWNLKSQTVNTKERWGMPNPPCTFWHQHSISLAVSRFQVVNGKEIAVFHEKVLWWKRCVFLGDLTGWMFILRGSSKKVSQLDRVRKYLNIWILPKNGSVISGNIWSNSLRIYFDCSIWKMVDYLAGLSLPYQNSAQWTAWFATEKNPPKVECLDLWSPNISGFPVLHDWT